MKFIYLYPNHNILKTIVPMIKPNIMVCQIEDENVGNKARQILNPYIIFENKNDKAVFHNFQVLAEYKK